MIHAIGVAIPARDEAGSIEACLTSVAVAAGRVRTPVVVVLAADSCLDDTVERAVATASANGLDLEVVTCRYGSAGLARRAAGQRLAMRLDGLGFPAESTWVASTDADTTVPADWFVRQLAWEADGVDAVAGLVDIGPDAPAQLRALFEMATMEEGRGPGHRHVHGANLGIRGSVLHAVGGFPDVALGEDHELWARIGELPVRRLGVIDTTVVTSRRLVSHTVGGFATFLAALPTEA